MCKCTTSTRINKADGVVTPKERAKLAKTQNKQSKKIYKQKHDTQKKVPAAS